MNAATASTKAAVVTLAVAAAVAGSPTVRACGYHDPSAYNVGMLNWAYPDALHVRTAVWMAQRDGFLAPAESPPAVDAASSQARLQQMMRLREMQARLDALRAALDAAAAGRLPPAFAVVLIGPMLWTRFEADDGGVRMASHSQGPAPDDVVVVTDAPVLVALVDGSLTFRSAHARGLAKLYGSHDAVERVAAILDHAARLARHLDPVQEN